jgi:hypothetical protein
MRLYTCFLHVAMEKAGALQFFSLRARNVHELLHQLDSFVCLKGSDYRLSGVFINAHKVL